MIHETICFFNKFGLNPDGKDKSLPTMYWKQKMHKEVIGTRFIVVSKSEAENLFQKYFLTLLNLSSIKYKFSTINHISIFHLNNFGL